MFTKGLQRFYIEIKQPFKSLQEIWTQYFSLKISCITESKSFCRQIFGLQQQLNNIQVRLLINSTLKTNLLIITKNVLTPGYNI